MKGLSVLAAVVLVVVMMYPCLGSATNISPALSCDPDCSHTSDGDKVVDPYNCTRFYYCLDGEPTNHPSECPAGSFFNPVNQVCETGECDSICGSGPGCQLTCNATSTVIGDAFNCNIYYYCTPTGYVGPISCPDDRPYFDGYTSTCSIDEYVCCRGYCEPYCDGSGFATVPDPTDCTKYYICDSNAYAGIPDENVHFSCDDGEYFNIQDGRCQGDIPSYCPTLCEAVKKTVLWG